MNASQEIHDLIQQFPLECSQRAIDALLTIVDQLNRRIDDLELKQRRIANIASCLANGIQPD